MHIFHIDSNHHKRICNPVKIWKTWIIANIVLLVTIFISEALYAGPFLDLDIGVNIPCDAVKSASVTDYTYSCGQVAQDNPIGIVRAGWQFKSHQVWKVEIQPHIYFEHASSIVTSHERGLNVIMTGVRIQ